ncbi:MAG: DNA polymerase III subunit delta [Bacteroidales bacterium]|jgi:DNA polymerase-3 subunit delta|nr:DNA polymerase III subunit delta [Bacteroidales bacterium]
MEYSNYKEIIAAFKKKEYAPVYLLEGTEDYFIDKVSVALEEGFFADESYKDFDYQVLYGKETSVAEIIVAAKQFPMLSPYRLVVVREAQSVDKLKELEEYAKKPQTKTVLALCYKHGTVDGKSTFYKAISKNGVVFKPATIYDNQLPAYIKEIAKDKKYTLSQDAINLLATYIGANLTQIDNELSKLVNVLPPGSQITPDIIEQYIGISKKYNNYEFCNAVMAKEEAKAYEILDHLSKDDGKNDKGKQRASLVNTLYSQFFSLLQYEYLPNEMDRKTFLKGKPLSVYDLYRKAAGVFPIPKIFRIIALLRQYDLMNKGSLGVSVPENELVKELIFKIFQIAETRR